MQAPNDVAAKSFDPSQDDVNDFIMDLCKKGRLDELKKFTDTYNDIVEQECYCWDQAMFEALKAGFLEIAKWIAENFSEEAFKYKGKYHWNIDFEKAFVEVCSRSDIASAEWLASLSEVKPEAYTKAFQAACSISCNLELVEWIYSKFHLTTRQIHGEKWETVTETLEEAPCSWPVLHWLEAKLNMKIIPLEYGYEIATFGAKEDCRDCRDCMIRNSCDICDI